MKRVWLLLFLLSPLSVHAATVGFAQESVWLSHTPVIAGESVSIYAALTNGGKDPLTSVAYFRDNGATVGSIPVSLSPGEARIVSISWTPAAGKHALAVELASSSVELAAPTQTTSVTVEKSSPLAALALPGTNATAAVAYSDSSALQSKLEDLSPTVAAYADPVLQKLDSWRLSGSDFLSNQTKHTQTKVDEYTAQKKALEGATSADAKSKSRILMFEQMLYTFLVYILTAFHMLIAKAAFFFPFLALLFFFVLWKVYRRFRRPTYSY